MANRTAIDHAPRIAALWAAWLIVMLFHVELGLMPLFHGIPVAIESHVAAARLPQLFLAMLLYTLAPVAAMLLATYAATAGHHWSAAGRWRAGQCLLGGLYSVTNLGHLVADIVIPDSRLDQVLLMAVLTLIGLLINRETWLWWRG